MTLRSPRIERTGRSAGISLLREYLLRVDAERRKRIDGYIDYFGNAGALAGIPRGPRRGVARPRMGERDSAR